MISTRETGEEGTTITRNNKLNKIHHVFYNIIIHT